MTPEQAFDLQFPERREDMLFELALSGRIRSSGEFNTYVGHAQKLPYRNRLRLLKRIRDCIGEETAQDLESRLSWGSERV